MFTIKGKEKDITIKTSFIKTVLFQNKYLKDDEMLLEVLPTKSMTKDGVDFLVKMIEHFQVIDEKQDKLNEEKIMVFLDDLFETKESSVFDIYKEFMKEFDYSGVIAKGMGFTLAEKLDEQMELMKKKMKETEIQLPQEKIDTKTLTSIEETVD